MQHKEPGTVGGTTINKTLLEFKALKKQHYGE